MNRLLPGRTGRWSRWS